MKKCMMKSKVRRLFVAAVGSALFLGAQAAQADKYGPSSVGTNPFNIWLSTAGAQVEIKPNGPNSDSQQPYYGTINCGIPDVPGVTNNYSSCQLTRQDGGDSQTISGWVSSSHFYIGITSGNGPWTLNLESVGQTTHYGGDGHDCWATPGTSAYAVTYTRVGHGPDGSGSLQIVSTTGDKVYVQGSVNIYNIQSTSYFTPWVHHVDCTYGGSSGSFDYPLIWPRNASPTVSITAPSGGATYTEPATVNITASASDTDGTIAKVEFYQGGTKLGEDTSSSGGWTHSWTGVAEGAYSLTAKAFDDNGASTISAAVGITVNPRPTPTIANAAASGLTANSATLNGNLTSTGAASTTVFVYWGTVDRGQTTSGWDGSQNLGTRSPGAVSHPVSGLAQGTYYYRFYASNSAGAAWADPAASFKTLSVPVVDNDGGATNITAIGARLRGTLTAGGSAAVTIYWGTVDGGTSPSAWQHAISLGTANEVAFFSDLSGLNPSATYRYRCYAENVVGTDWADATSTFQTPELTDYRMKITFSGYTNRTEALTNFPALVVFDTSLSNFDYAQFLSPDAYDLRFRDAGDTVDLNYEIERWNTGGSSYVWVQVPLIRTNSDYIWASWGNLVATNRPACTTNGATWDATFKAVWHMNQMNIQDSTANRINGTANGNTLATGPIGDGGSFNGSGAYVSLPSGFADFTGGLTISVWANPSSAAGWSRFVDFGNGSANNNILFARNWTGPDLTYQVFSGTTAGAHVTAFGALVLNTWQHLTVAQNPGGAATIYKNGVSAGSGNTSVPVNVTRTNNYIGKSNWGQDALYAGILDEVRIENVARSSNWVWASYMTMAANTAFNTYGAVSVTSGSSGQTVNGIPYAWLSGYGIADTNDSVELLDSDGDGADNLNEYFAGTDPTNAASLLKVVQVSPGAASNFVLDWASVAGKVYSVEWIADLMTPPWGTVASNIAATPPLNVHTVGVTGANSGFYRVDVQH